MSVEIKNIPISDIETNKGQIEGVPANPRTIKDKKFKKLVQSIEANPEMLELRELLVYPLADKYVIIGGNMRYEACKRLGYKELPCKVIPPETDAGTLCAYVVKDNGGYGEWDFDALANEWDEGLLDVAGIDLPEIKIPSIEEPTEDEAKPYDFGHILITYDLKNTPVETIIALKEYCAKLENVEINEILNNANG